METTHFCTYGSFGVGWFGFKVINWRFERNLTNQLQAIHQNSLKGLEDGKPLPYEEIKETCSYLVESVFEGDVQSLLGTVHNHDNGTFAHSLKVAAILGSFANFKGLNKQDTLEVVTGGMLHDMGKPKIPLNDLFKQARAFKGRRI